MTKKELLRVIAFGLLVCLLLLPLCDLFELDDVNITSRFYTYRNLEKNSIDAVYFGTSGVDRYWLGAKAYEEYGMSVYPLTSDGMPIWLYDLMIDEALTYQNPKLLIFDVRAFGQDTTADNVDIRGRRVIDSMNFFSVNRWKTAFRTMEVRHRMDESLDEFDLSYLLPYIKFHSKWSEDDYRIEEVADEEMHEYGGFVMHSTLSIYRNDSIVEIPYDVDHYEPLEPIAEESLYKVISYTKELGIDILFVDTPQFMDELEMGRANTIRKILAEEGVDCVSYNVPGAEEELNINLYRLRDFYNSNHVNYYGAEKYTASLSAYLDEKYDLPDRRNDPAAQKYWDGMYENIKATIVKFREDRKDRLENGGK